MVGAGELSPALTFLLMYPYPYTHDYIPPKSFLKRVRSEVDKHIDIRWNTKTHSWGVFYTNPETSHSYLIFKTPELDQRVIYRLQIGDSRRWPNANIIHRELLEREERHEKEREKKLEEERKYKIKQDLTLWMYAMKNATQGNLG